MLAGEYLNGDCPCCSAIRDSLPKDSVKSIMR